MAAIKTLVFAGGQIHNFKGCGAELKRIMAADDRFAVTYVEDDLNVFAGNGLAPYELLVFYYTVGQLSEAQKAGLLNWVAAGKGYVGIHSAADSFRGCPEYRAMVGGHFVTHPRYRDYQVTITDPEHPIMKGLVDVQPAEFMVKDEMYVTSFDARNRILAQALWGAGTVPVAWVKDWGQGRVFWLALGHDPAACQQAIFAKLLVRGALWAATPPPPPQK